MSIFSDVEQAKREHDACIEEVRVSYFTMKDIVEEVKNRIEREKRLAGEQIAELQETVADASRSDTIRRIATNNLTELQSKTYFASPDEVEAFEEEKRNFIQSLTDAAAAKTRFYDLLNSAIAELDGKKHEIASAWGVPFNNWLDGVVKDFSMLKSEVQP